VIESGQVIPDLRELIKIIKRPYCPLAKHYNHGSINTGSLTTSVEEATMGYFTSATRIFVYGVLLNPKNRKKYCPEAILLSVGCVPDHRLIFDGQSIRRPGATANIREEEGQIVWGALFEIRELELEQLDKFENRPTSYDRKQVTVLTAEGLKYEDVWVYFREGQPEGKPGAEYFGEVLEGAQMCGLPSSYIEALETVETL
jgi:gamma-glutamylcyclotransferase (GGCT)/AIG2-like uncharacterized protein YtfP